MKGGREGGREGGRTRGAEGLWSVTSTVRFKAKRPLVLRERGEEGREGGREGGASWEEGREMEKGEWTPVGGREGGRGGGAGGGGDEP